MKKQILFLTFFVAAILAGTTAFGQVTLNTEEDYLTAPAEYCAPAKPLTNCGVGNSLAPMPGVPYDYEIDKGATGNTVHWFVTDDLGVMTAQETLTGTRDPGDATGTYLLEADITATTGTYNNPVNASETITLTWKSFNGTGAANSVLLVAYVIDVAGCTDNIEVYRIEPGYAFTLDLAGIQDDGAAHADPFAPTECVSPVQSATYDGTTEVLTVQYGINYVYYTVNAANWQTSWETDLLATNTTTGPTLSTLGLPEWQYPDLAEVATGWNASGTVVDASHPAYIADGLSVDGFVDFDGACIIVRVPVDHAATTENIVDETINLVVNGLMENPLDGTYAGYPDLDDSAVLGDACIVDQITDNLDYIITPRPDLTNVDPIPFEDKTPSDTPPIIP